MIDSWCLEGFLAGMDLHEKNTEKNITNNLYKNRLSIQKPLILANQNPQKKHFVAPHEFRRGNFERIHFWWIYVWLERFFGGCSLMISRALLLQFLASVGVGGMALTFHDLDGLGDEWDENRDLRQRVQAIGCLVVNAPAEGLAEVNPGAVVSRSIENARYNMPVLKPLFAKMAGELGKIPDLQSLQNEVEKAFRRQGKKPKDSKTQAWSIRYLFGIVKHLQYKPQPPRDPCLSLIINNRKKLTNLKKNNAIFFNLLDFFPLGIVFEIGGGLIFFLL